MASFDQLIRGANAYIALALILVLASLPGLVAMPTMDRDEARFAEASSEMLQTGDFVVIRYHEDLRNKKPVGIHWLQAATVAAVSSEQARDIATYRIPSLLGAIMAAWATFWGGTTLFNRRAAFIAGAVLASTLLLSSEAHIAKTDAAQCGFVALMMASLIRLRVKPSKWDALIFWFTLGAGVLLKGVISPMIAVTTILTLFALERKLLWLKPLLMWSGITLFCVMTIPWTIAVQVATGGEFLITAAKVDLGQKIVHAAEGHGSPPGFHTALLPILFWPGTLLLIPGITLAIVELTGMRRNGPAGQKQTLNPAVRIAAKAWQAPEAASWRFLACWILPSWLIFELAPTKLPHYTLPLYPALALMCGAAADRWLETAKWTGSRWVALALFLVPTMLIIAAVSPWALEAFRADAAHDFGRVLADRVEAVWRRDWDKAGVGLWPSLLILLIAGATVYAFVRKSGLGVLAGLLGCSLIGGVALRTMVLPNQTWVLPSEAAMSALREVCAFPEGSARWNESGCEGRAPKFIRAVGFAEPSLVFELGNHITLAEETTTDMPAVADDNRPAWLIDGLTEEGRTAIGRIVEQAASADRCVRFARRFVKNYSNNDPQLLTAVVVEPAGCIAEAPPDELRPSQGGDEPELEGSTDATPRPPRAPPASAASPTPAR
jgi:4-amino-4-deoxy-L-arabinose transferase-like glycosyltransferase